MTLSAKQLKIMESMEVGKWIDTPTLQIHTGLPYRSLLQTLHRLEARGILVHRYAQKRQIEWKLTRKEEKEVNQIPREVPPVHASDLLTALNVFSRKHKLPKFIETGAYKAYAQAVGGLYKHAVDVCYGAAPSKEELMFYRKDLVLYAKQLQDHLRGVQAILNCDALWSEETSSEFVLSAPIIPQLPDLKNLAESAIKENQ